MRPLTKAIPFLFLAAFALSACAAAEISNPIAGARVYFTPGDDAEGATCAEIAKAKASILVQTYSFTSVPIAKALAAAAERGVRVQVISDADNEQSRYTALDFVAGKGIEVTVDDKVRIAHNKVMIIDAATVITGSFNWTKAAQHDNAENLIVLPSAELASVYTTNWQTRRAVARPYLRRASR
jgi:phosphatidylserine/phosphatidylglycerophosphate/cardiolipin synthase-like enzyme